MKIQIPYAKEEVVVEVADDRILGVIEPNPVYIGDENEIVEEGIQNPINSKSFDDFIKDVYQKE